jgi:hypothetical protein
MKLPSDRALVAASTAAILFLVVAVCFVEPGSTALLPACPFHALTGLYCPGCGSTRMLYFLVHGQFASAWHENALTMLMLPVILYGLARQWTPSGKAVFTRIPSRWITTFAAVLVLFTIARNLPWEPFRQLAPVDIAAAKPQLNATAPGQFSRSR